MSSIESETTDSETTESGTTRPLDKREPEFRLRGEAMSRIETFVAAAFAFVVTMLVISVGDLPESVADYVHAVKRAPGLLASFAVVIWIWNEHAIWSRRYGLEDSWTIVLSALLVFSVLVYVYPLRVTMQGLFYWISGGYFTAELSFSAAWEIRFMFAFFATGFLALTLIFFSLYHHAHRRRDALQLSYYECFETQTNRVMWLGAAAVCLLAMLLAILLPISLAPFSGFTYGLLWPVLYGIGIYRLKSRGLE